MCGKTTVKVKGLALASIEPEGGEDVLSLSGKLEGTKGKPALTKYFNNKEEEVEAKLESSVGSLFNVSNEVVGEAIKMVALPQTGSTLPQMFTILNL